MKILLFAGAAALMTVEGSAAATAPTDMAAPAFEPTRFSVEVVGEGDRDILLIPGLLSPRSVWDGQVGALAADHRLHLVEVAGFGDTDSGANAEGPVLPHLVEEIAAYIEAHGLDDVALVGHSMGGFASLHLALDRPDLVDRVMIVDSLPFFSVLMGADDAEAARPRASAMRDMMVAQAGNERPGPDCEKPSVQARGMAKDPAAQCLVDRYNASADLRVGGQLMYEIMTTDLRPRLGDLAVPVMMLYPVDPPMVSAAMAAGVYPVQYAAAGDKVTFVPVENSRHFIMLDRPDAMATALEAFLHD